MIELERGKPYPFPLMAQDGAAAQFLTKSGNILQIALSDMNSDDVKALRYGKIKAGFLYQQGALLWLFIFHNKKGQKLFTLDAPFDARMIPKDILALHNIENDQQRLTIELHAVDGKGIVRALRHITMPNDLTLEFLSAVQDQLSTHEDPNVMAGWMMRDPGILSDETKMRVLGK